MAGPGVGSYMASRLSNLSSAIRVSLKEDVDHHAEREDRKSVGMFREAGGGGVEEDNASGGVREAMIACRRAGMGGRGSVRRRNVMVGWWLVLSKMER